MQQILEHILGLIQTHGLLAMVIGGFVEQVIVPIPSPIITMAGGAFLVPQDLPFFETIWQIILRVSLPYSIAATIGTSFVYLVAYYGGRPLIDKFGKYVGISWSLIEEVKTEFQKTIRDEVFILIASSIPVVPVSLISAFSGGFRTPPVKFYSMIFLALIIRSIILGYVGYQMGEAFTSLAYGLDKIESVFTVIGAGLVLGFLYLRREKWIKNKG